METIGPPAVSGRFYPRDPKELRRAVRHYLSLAVRERGTESPKALIVPHAGYQYSGPIAASGYRYLFEDRDTIKRLVLIGPAHFVPFEGLALSSAAQFETPLGQVKIGQDLVDAILELPQVLIFDEAHEEEHSLKVQLPFLQEILPDFTIVPLVVGDAGTKDVAQVIELLWGGPETRIIVSSDLSHYENYETAYQRDHATQKAIENLKPEEVLPESACGYLGIRGFLSVASRRRMKPQTLDLRNSGDTAGSRDSVVGYGAFAFYEA